MREKQGIEKIQSYCCFRIEVKVELREMFRDNTLQKTQKTMKQKRHDYNNHIERDITNIKHVMFWNYLTCFDL